MPDITINIEVFCACGDKIGIGSTGKKDQYGNLSIEDVIPCFRCVRERGQKEYIRGYDDGLADEV